MAERRARRIGIDTGGTFTDLSLDDGETVRVAKVPSTPDDPARAIAEGLAKLGGTTSADEVIHGTTVALNALLTGAVARVALVTNEGFRDLIEIGRQDREDIYALHPVKPRALVPRKLRFEVPQRVWPQLGRDETGRAGRALETVREPTPEELAALAERIRRSKADAVAVCLLHSWADPSIEERIGDALAPLGLPVTLSARILAEHREYERFSTACVNAALTPLMHDYLASLESRVGGARLSVLQSTGGALAADVAAREPVRVILSGPAGGVVGAARAASEAGFDAFCGLDMGGTSTDVAFHEAHDGAAEQTPTRALDPVRVAGHPIGVPSLDIHTIGCGGGSLVSIDAGGVLHVGPESAGADPGPVCYGKSERPTVTDAHVLLGHIAEGNFLGGELRLDVDAVHRAFERIGERLGVGPVDAARGVLDVARAAMRRATSVMTMERGKDPERIPLVAFGGAGGLHAAALAGALRMRAAIVPSAPGALSARGMTVADAMRDASRTILEPLVAWGTKARSAAHRELASAARGALVDAGAPRRAIVLEHGMDLRYRGQSYEITIAECADPSAAFHAAHAALYGYALEGRDVELVCLRTRARVPAPRPERTRPRAKPLPRSRIAGEREVVFEERVRTPLVHRDALAPGHTFDGPFLVEEYSGTTLVPPGWRARVTTGDHLVLTPR